MPYRFYDFYPQQFPRVDARKLERRREADRASLVLRLDGYYDVFVCDESGHPRIDPETGKRLTQTAGFWGTSLCSGEKVLMRFSSAEEMRADGLGRPAGRRDLQAIRDAAPSMAGAADLPEEKRPIVRCDSTRFVKNDDGRLKASVRFELNGDTTVHAQMRSAWMTPYPSFTLRSGEEIFPQEHMECDRFSTVNFSLHGRPDAGFNYYRLCEESMKRSFANGVTSYAKACSNASFELVNAWQLERERDPATRVGSLSVTTWHPDECLRFSLADAGAKGQKALEDLFSMERFQPQAYVDREGKSRMARPKAMPELILRFLNARDEVCGVYRMRAGEIGFLDHLAQRIGKKPPESAGQDETFWKTPQGKACFIIDEMVKGLDRDFVDAAGVTQVDILPGCCRQVDPRLVQGQDTSGRETKASLYQLRNLIYLGLSQGRAPKGAMRQNVGCAQAFVPRTAGDRVTGWYTLRDGSSYHNACLLLADGRRLNPSEEYALELAREKEYLNNLSLYYEDEQDAAAQATVRAGQEPVGANDASPAARDPLADLPDLPDYAGLPVDDLPWEVNDEDDDAGPRP